jgi:cytochrome b6-f complex iron-sulfur subunit
MDRKEFLKTCGFACLGSTALATLVQSCASTNYFAKTLFDDKKITIKKIEFLKTEKNSIKERKYVLIRSEKMAFPICVYKISETEYSALLMQCTHNGCELQPQGSFLVCPCHGSEFSNTGMVQNPPAEQNLVSFHTTADHENIYIHF